MTELVLLFVVALLVLGPDKLPAFARRAGGFIRHLRQQAEAARRMVEDELALGEHGEAFNELRRLRGEVAQLRAAVSTQAQHQQWWLPSAPDQEESRAGHGVDLGKATRPDPAPAGPDAPQQTGAGDGQAPATEPIAVQLEKTAADQGALDSTSPQAGHEETSFPLRS